MSERYSRREFIVLGTASAVGLGCFVKIDPAYAKQAGLPSGMSAVPDSDPVATSLGYKPSTKLVDKAKFPNFKPNQNCANCSFYAAANSGWGNCQVLKSGAVSAKGWCASWNNKS
jgi:hypothetical protein